MQETIQIYFGETKLVHCEISLSAVGTDPHLVGRGRPSQWFIELSTNLREFLSAQENTPITTNAFTLLKVPSI